MGPPGTQRGEYPFARASDYVDVFGEVGVIICIAFGATATVDAEAGGADDEDGGGEEGEPDGEMHEGNDRGDGIAVLTCVRLKGACGVHKSRALTCCWLTLRKKIS